MIKCTLSSITFHLFKPLFVIPWSSLWQTNFIPSTVPPVSFAVTVNFRPSHSFNQFGFSLVSIFPSTILLLFSYSACSFCHSNTVKSCFQVVCSPKIPYFFSKKKSCNICRFRFDFGSTTIGFQKKKFKISFCCRLFTRSKISMPCMSTAVYAYK